MTEVGRWRIVLFDGTRSTARVDEIIVWDPDVGGELDPDIYHDTVGLHVHYTDRSRTIYPWNNIIKAEWKPTT